MNTTTHTLLIRLSKLMSTVVALIGITACGSPSSTSAALDTGASDLQAQDSSVLQVLLHVNIVGFGNADFDLQGIHALDTFTFYSVNDGCTLHKIWFRNADDLSWKFLTSYGNDEFGSATPGKRLYASAIRFEISRPTYGTCTVGGNLNTSEARVSQGLSNALAYMSQAGVPMSANVYLKFSCDSYGTGSCEIQNLNSQQSYSLNGQAARNIYEALELAGATQSYGSDSFFMSGRIIRETYQGSYQYSLSSDN